MKLSSIKYLTGTGLKNMWVNKLMTFASVGTLVACMLIIGVAVMIAENVTNTLKGIEQQNVIMVYFNDRNSVVYGDADPLVAIPETEDSSEAEIPYDAYLIHNKEEALKVVEEIKKLENVTEVTYISKEESLEAVMDKYLQGQDTIQGVLTEDEDSNPLSDGAKIVVSDMQRYNETASALKRIKGVTSVTAQGDIADKLVAITDALRTAGFWIIAILLLISLVIVSNTIRVTMYNRKLEISIMKAVGATDSFIRLPFMIEGVFIGLISSGIAFGLMYLMHSAIITEMSKALSLSTIVPFRTYAPELLGLFAAIGLISGVFGSVIMMGRYLRKEGSEFRAL